MKAVLVAVGVNAPDDRLSADIRGLLPLVDRPLLQHQIERIVSAECTQIHLLAAKDASQIRRSLGDGRRWGCALHIHELSTVEQAYAVIEEQICDDEERVLLLHSDRLPACDFRELLESPEQMLVIDSDQQCAAAIVDSTLLQAAPIDDGIAAVRDFLSLLRGRVRSVDCPRVLKVGTLEDLLAAQRAVLCGEFRELFINGREKTEGVRICRNTAVHATAELNGPVFLGDNVCVGPGARIGPNAVISDNCIIDKNASVQNSLVLPNTYVGEWIEVNDCVVQKNDLINVRLHAALEVDDPLVLCGL